MSDRHHVKIESNRRKAGGGALLRMTFIHITPENEDLYLCVRKPRKEGLMKNPRIKNRRTFGSTAFIECYDADTNELVR